MNKYHARPVTIDNIRFDSKAEGEYYCELKLLEQAGEIKKLRVHVRYPLHVKKVKIGVYEADFVYETKDGRTVVEDVKGVRTPLYRRSKKHFEAEYEICIDEITGR